jgi:putative ABC transport system ATP-binding protein
MARVAGGAGADRCHSERGGDVSDAPALLDARDLVKDFRLGGRSVRALRGVSVAVRKGEYVGITGPSGSGKSTLLHTLGGLDAPDSGTVSLEGVALDQLQDSALTRLRLLRMGFVFQRFHLLPVLTALENVELPMAEAGVGRAERKVRALELLEYVGLAERADHRATQLSGGEMQRVAIARALANRPALLFADEPTGELDLSTGRQILELFRRMNEDGMTIVVVTHDEHLAREASRTIQLLDGLIAGPIADSR